MSNVCLIIIRFTQTLPYFSFCRVLSNNKQISLHFTQYVSNLCRMSSHHSIQSVARRTGLSAHVIRVWEKRYGAVKPSRTGTNRRLYSDEEIERLQLLRLATEAGHSIGNIAALDLEKLKQIASPVGDLPPARGK